MCKGTGTHPVLHVAVTDPRRGSAAARVEEASITKGHRGGGRRIQAGAYDA